MAKYKVTYNLINKACNKRSIKEIEIDISDEIVKLGQAEDYAYQCLEFKHRNKNQIIMNIEKILK